MKRTLFVLFVMAMLTATSAFASDLRDLFRGATVTEQSVFRGGQDHALDNIVLIELDPANGFPQCVCISACPGDTVVILVGPGLQPWEYPYGTHHSGCLPEDERIPIPFQCDDECDPVTPHLFGGMEPSYDPLTGTFGVSLWVDACGCFCLCLEGILDVELVSFTATPRDGEIQLNWQTASESEGSRFEILRDGNLVNRLDAQGSAIGGVYSWTDQSVANGTEYNYALVGVDASGIREDLATISATPNSGSATVSEFALYQNFPNPFNPETSIAFDVATAGFVQLSIFNIMGQNIATPIAREMEAGRHVVSFSGSDLPSGLYLYRMEAAGFSDVRKMILMK